MEIASGYMKPEQVLEEVQEIVSLFQSLQIQDLIIFYGFGCECDIEEQYQDIAVKTDVLLDFLSQSMARGIYCFGDADFYIESRPRGIQFLLCHEGDVHIETENRQVANHFHARWSAKGPPGCEKKDGVWVPLSGAQVLEGQLGTDRS